MIKMKKAFSLIEVIFVLTILGIVASISSQIIVQVYENYIIQNALYKTTTKTELAINQIVNRLTYAIDGTTITKDPLSTTPYTKANEGNNWVKLNDIDINIKSHSKFTTIEWIGYDNDSFSAGKTPYWSGLAKYDAGGASRTQFETPASQLNLADTIIKNLSNNKVSLTGANLPAIVFSDRNYLNTTPPIEYDPACMGIVDENNRTCISSVSMIDNTHFRFSDNRAKSIYEHYKLAWSAYALVPEASKTNSGLFNINLYYNYQPWNGEKYSDGEHSLLIDNISVFKFTENGGVVQLKLCATENIGKDYNISSCKEKAIIR